MATFQNDPRLGDLWNRNDQRKSRLSILGFPSDEGVRRNGGRPGASEAPALIRERLSRLTPYAVHQDHHTKFLQHVVDTGNLKLSGNVEQDQMKLGEEVQKLLKRNAISLIIGGGHETSYGHFLGYAYAGMDVSILNIDAHTDVRSLKDGIPHSGSPFRQALEHKSGVCKNYSVFGLNPESVSADHIRYVREEGGTAKYRDSTNLMTVLDQLDWVSTDQIMVTMDMDAVTQEAAPGVSAPAALGLTPGFWLELAYRFGMHPKVSSFDICEVNPRYDTDNRTIRLAALTAWYFILGVSLRESE